MHSRPVHKNEVRLGATRKSLGHSKTLENHSLAASIHICAHNMIRRHEAIKTTPAIALGVATEAWTLERLVDMTDEYLKQKENAEFEAAYAAAYNSQQEYHNEPKLPPQTIIYAA